MRFQLTPSDVLYMRPSAAVAHAWFGDAAAKSHSHEGT